MKDCFIVRRGGGADFGIKASFLKDVINLNGAIEEEFVVNNFYWVYDVESNSVALCIVFRNTSLAEDITTVIEIGDSETQEIIIPHKNTTISENCSSFGYNITLFDNLPQDLSQLKILAQNNIKISQFSSIQSLGETFLEENANAIIYTHDGRNYTKKNNGKALVGVFLGDDSAMRAIAISAISPDAVTLSDYGTTTVGTCQFTYNNHIYYIGFGKSYLKQSDEDDPLNKIDLKNHLYFGKYQISKETVMALDGSGEIQANIPLDLIQQLLPIAEIVLADSNNGGE